MPCAESNSFPTWLGLRRVDRFYNSQQECEQDCENPEGACCNGVTCRSVKPCQCIAQNDQFMGIGTTCNPTPCNPLP
jgi:hypothetical protein